MIRVLALLRCFMFKREIVNVSTLYYVFFFIYICVCYILIECICMMLSNEQLTVWPNIMKSKTLLQHLTLLLTRMQSVMSIRSEELTEAFSK